MVLQILLKIIPEVCYLVIFPRVLALELRHFKSRTSEDPRCWLRH